MEIQFASFVLLGHLPFRLVIICRAVSPLASVDLVKWEF